jgi:hypothetical protein
MKRAASLITSRIAIVLIVAGAAAQPFVTLASFRRNNFRFTHGAPREIAWAGRVRSFCARCGTALTFLSQPDTDEVDVTVCSFDHAEAVPLKTTPG